MKIDVVIGNPPYQEMTEGGGNAKRGMALYPQFILAAQQLADYVSMVTPTRWYTQTEFELLRNKMLNGQLISLYDYTDAKECFNNVSIAGGVSYWLWNKNHNGTAILKNKTEEWEADLKLLPILLRYKYAYTVAKKIKQIDGNKLTFDKIVQGTDTFGVKRERFGDNNISDAKHTILLLHSKGDYEYIDESNIKKNNKYINCYKLYTEYMNGSSETVFHSLEILEPNEICDLSFIVIAAVVDEALINNIKTYFETKLVRFLIKATLTNTTITKNNYQLVPMQDFKHSWTDQMLYERYSLTPDEIQYIESTIKPMDNKKLKVTLEDLKANELYQQLK